MSQVISCMEKGCAYNRGFRCLAKVVTVGNHQQATCEALRKDRVRYLKKDGVGNVEKCKMAGCLYNEGLKCTAFAGVRLTLHNGHVACETCKVVD
jgi:hypothetical protein